jgi:ribonucleoside-triphosphate reductase
MFNCEIIPAENVGVKHAKWDREDGYFVPRDCYNSYFYVVEDDSLTVLDKFRLHSAPYIEHLTGGSALHMNLEEHLSKAQYQQLAAHCRKEGCTTSPSIFPTPSATTADISTSDTSKSAPTATAITSTI